MGASDSQSIQREENKPWIYAFLILLLVSIYMFGLRIMNASFLQTDFEVSLVYLPTVLAGLIAFNTTRKRQKPP
jgi:hypothetical protein